MEYGSPGDAIRNIHDRHESRLSKFSVTVKLSGTDGKMYDTYLYSTKGVYEICRWPHHPEADAQKNVIDKFRKWTVDSAYPTEIPYVETKNIRCFTRRRTPSNHKGLITNHSW